MSSADHDFTVSFDTTKYQDKTINHILDEIDRIYKDDIKEVCPECNTPMKVVSNPWYWCHCSLCGWKGRYDSLEMITKKDIVRKLLNDTYPGIL